MTRTTRTTAAVAGLCAVALAATAAPVGTAAAAPDTDRPAQLLREQATPDAAQGRVGERTRGVRLDGRALASSRPGERIALRLFDDESVTAVVTNRSTAGDTTTWSGDLQGETGSFSAVEVDGTHHITISSADHGTVEITADPSGAYTVAEVPRAGNDTYDAVVPDHADHAEGAPSTRAQPSAPVAEADGPNLIDVAIVYPASLPAGVGDAAMRAQFAQAIAQTNQALAASQTGTQVRLVGTRQVAAPQLSTLLANYQALDRPNDGIFDEAQQLREQTHADLVSLWLGGTYPAGQSCGLGSIGGGSSQFDPERAAWTVLWADQCATGTFTFAHEIGHNLSADHDGGASAPPNRLSKPYARGWVDLGARTTTVMAYWTQCAGAGVTCTPIANFSNPNVAADGRSTAGVDPANGVVTNNAQAITEQAGAVAGYRQSQIYPGAIGISGRARYKGTARATTTPWAPAVAFGYQWYVDGVAVPGANASTFRLSRGHIGRSLSVAVSGSAPYYATVSAGSAGVVVGKALFRTSRPKVRGIPRAGRVLSVKLKRWSPKPSKKSVKVRYQWLRNGKKIKGAKSRTYRVRAKDRRKKISVRVTTKKKYYDKATRTSKKVRIRR